MHLNRGRIETFQDCNRKYHNSYNLNLTLNKTSKPLRIGSAVHRFIETLEELTSEGGDRENLIQQALASAGDSLLQTQLPQINESFIQEETKIHKEVELICKLYAEEYKNSDFIVLEPEVEGSFPIGPHTIVFKTDGVGTWKDQLWLRETKTTAQFGASFFDKFNFNFQIILYILGVSYVLKRPIVGVMVDAIRKPHPTAIVPKPEFKRIPVVIPQHQRIEAIKNIGYLANDIASRDPLNAEEWPQNTNRCFDYGGCPFWTVCAHGAPAEVGALFKQRDPDYVDEARLIEKQKEV